MARQMSGFCCANGDQEPSGGKSDFPTTGSIKSTPSRNGDDLFLSKLTQKLAFHPPLVSNFYASSDCVVNKGYQNIC